MTRTLSFEGEKGAKRFELLYEALLGGGATQTSGGERSAKVIRQEARIFELLDPVSEPDPALLTSCPSCGRQANEDARKLRTHADVQDASAPERPLVVTLKQEDLALLEKYVDARPWLPRMARRVVDLMDWLSAAPKQE